MKRKDMEMMQARTVIFIRQALISKGMDSDISCVTCRFPLSSGKLQLVSSSLKTPAQLLMVVIEYNLNKTLKAYCMDV